MEQETYIPTPEELEGTVKKNKEEAKKECWERVKTKLNYATKKTVFLYRTDVMDIPYDEFKEVMNEKGFSVEYKEDEAPFGHIISW